MSKKNNEGLLVEALVPEEEQPCEVPENWIWVRTETTNNIVTGSTPAKKQSEYYGGDFPFVKPADLEQGSLVIHASEYLTEEGKAVSRIIPKDSTMVCCIGSIGKAGFSAVECTTNQQINSLVPNIKMINPKFNYYQVLNGTYQNELWNRSSATTVSIINKGKMSLIPYVLPPLNEQKRIARKVECLFNKIDEAKQLIEEAKETFELRREAILAKAFRGELTSKWRNENLSIESALERLELIKQERFHIAETKREISEITEMFAELNTEECIDNNDWLYLKANMFCYNINCGGTPSKDISEEGDIPFLKVYNIVNNKIDFLYKPQYIPKEIHESKLKKSILKTNDVIMNIVGPPLKKIAIIPEEYPEMNMNQAIVRFRPIKFVLPKYIYYCLQYDETLKEVINETRGVVGQSNISVSQSRNLVMPIPSLEEQALIVDKLEELIEREEIALNLVSDEKKLDELKQSILSKAFRGELGTNDPNDENAIELLKQVLQEQVK